MFYSSFIKSKIKHVFILLKEYSYIYVDLICFSLHPSPDMFQQSELLTQEVSLSFCTAGQTGQRGEHEGHCCLLQRLAF